MKEITPDRSPERCLRDLVRFNARCGATARLQGLDFFRCVEYAWALHFLLSEGSGRIFDLGSGTSILPYYLAYRGPSVLCADINIDLLRQNHAAWTRRLRLPEEACARLSLGREDATRLSLASNAFDRVSCISVIEHLEGDGDMTAVRELARVLAPGGRLVLSFPFGTWGESESYSHGSRFYQRYYDVQAIRQRLILPSGLRPEAELFFCNRFFDFENRLWRKIPRRALCWMGWTAPLLSRIFLAPKNRPLPSANGAMLVLKKER